MPPKKDFDIEELKRLYEELKSVAKVAKAVKAGAETVRSRLVEAGVELKKRGRPRLKETALDGAERVRRHRKKRRGTPKEDAP